MKRLPLKSIMFHELSSGRFNVPAVLFELNGLDIATNQVVQSGKKTWEMTYEITVFSSGADGRESVKSGHKAVYDVMKSLERERKSGRRLNGYARDIVCPSVRFGRLEVPTYSATNEYHGGRIQLVITVDAANVLD